MINTLRKHGKWLLVPVFGIVIISFVFFMGSGPARSGGGGSSGVNTNEVSGEIYGEKVTPELYDKMYKDVDLFCLFNYGQWADRIPNLTQDDLMRQIYLRMLLVIKAKQMGVYVSDDQVAKGAAGYLRSEKLVRAMGGNSSSVPFNEFEKEILEPHNYSGDDFENFVRDDMAVDQVRQTLSLPGQLVTPEDAAAEYVRQNREFSSQIVFFPASKYMDQVPVTSADVGEYYTNFMADYRLPDRVRVSYVLFSVSNYLGAALKEIGQTNLQLQVQNTYNKYGMRVVPDAKTPEEAQAQIRKIFLEQQALQNAVTQADEFAQSVFNVSSAGNKAPSAGDLFAVARQSGLKVETPAPFSADYGPQDFTAPSQFTKESFLLTPESPISEPVGTQTGVYVIALQTNLPSEIPPLDNIRARVRNDLQMREATMLAQQMGTNLVHRMDLQMAAGKSFAATAIAEGLDPEVLPSFSLSTAELPELKDRATLSQLKQAAFVTAVGTASPFVQTQDGGFVLYVSSRPPLDESKMTEELPQFTANLREQRAEDAYNNWLQIEGSRELRDTPLAKILGLR